MNTLDQCRHCAAHHILHETCHCDYLGITIAEEPARSNAPCVSSNM